MLEPGACRPCYERQATPDPHERCAAPQCGHFLKSHDQNYACVVCPCDLFVPQGARKAVSS
jgi:hypothetical protein